MCIHIYIYIYIYIGCGQMGSTLMGPLQKKRTSTEKLFGCSGLKFAASPSVSLSDDCTWRPGASHARETEAPVLSAGQETQTQRSEENGYWGPCVLDTSGIFSKKWSLGLGLFHRLLCSYTRPENLRGRRDSIHHLLEVTFDTCLFHFVVFLEVILRLRLHRNRDNCFCTPPPLGGGLGAGIESVFRTRSASLLRSGFPWPGLWSGYV